MELTSGMPNFDVGESVTLDGEEGVVLKCVRHPSWEMGHADIFVYNVKVGEKSVTVNESGLEKA